MIAITGIGTGRRSLNMNCLTVKGFTEVLVSFDGLGRGRPGRACIRPAMTGGAGSVHTRRFWHFR
ncbi:hypothetical protein [Thioflavicoccus mobilis]|uniref:hypothetical protein n=1 Tax=Thioflavicoccus mobilis TaxID=80679 RepID=UPI0012F7C1F4|nr:hypothetical protein [Thioflavicoccus mobilis]